ncbi:MAG: transposase [Terriglobales bacterium]
MPRRERCVLPGVPYHVTQRGVDRQATFSLDEDRHTYLRLLQENLSEADVRVRAWCLMSNHVHLVLLPGREDSLSLLLRRVHGRYAQYYNTRWGRIGHLWQSRFFSCILGIEHLWAALAYVERNPVRAGIVEYATEYLWSSAAAHVKGMDTTGLLDMQWWQNEGPKNWNEVLAIDQPETVQQLRQCTYAGRPFGTETFVVEIGKKIGRTWVRGRPKKKDPASVPAINPADQFSLF